VNLLESRQVNLQESRVACRLACRQTFLPGIQHPQAGNHPLSHLVNRLVNQVGNPVGSLPVSRVESQLVNLVENRVESLLENPL
jgi:hypothetical protein